MVLIVFSDRFKALIAAVINVLYDGLASLASNSISFLASLIEVLSKGFIEKVLFLIKKYIFDHLTSLSGHQGSFLLGT